MADVDLKFSADLEDIKHRLDEIEHNTSSWAEKIKQGIANAFSIDILHAFEHAVHSAFEFIHETVSESIEAAKEHELVFTRLELSIEHVRGGFAYSAETIKNWAIELENATGVGHEGIERVAASLARFHVSGETFKDAVTASLNIAAEQGGSAEGVASKIGRALAGLEQGQGFGVRRLREELADLTEEEKNNISELAKSGQGHAAVALVMDELNRKYKDAAEVIGNTLHGQLEKLHAIVHRVYEEIGEGLIPYIKEVLPLFQELAAYAEELAHKLGELFRSFAESRTGKGGMEGIKGAVEIVIGYVMEFFERIPLYLNVIETRVLQILNSIKHEIGLLVAGMPPLLTGKEGHELGLRLAGDAESSIMNVDKNARRAEVALENRGAFGDRAADRVEELHEVFKKLSDHSAEATMKLEAFVHSIVSFPERMADEAKTLWTHLGTTYTNAAKESLEKTDKEIEALKDKRFNQLREGNLLGAAETALGIQETETGQLASMEQMKKRRDALEDILKQESHEGPLHTKPFKSAIEDAASVFKRIQVGAASEADKDDIPKKQLTELGKLAEGQIKQIDNQLKEHELRAKLSDTLDKLHSFMKTGPRAA
jgi:hypothetical protein